MSERYLLYFSLSTTMQRLSEPHAMVTLVAARSNLGQGLPRFAFDCRRLLLAREGRHGARTGTRRGRPQATRRAVPAIRVEPTRCDASLLRDGQ